MNANISKGLDHSKTFEVVESKRWVCNDGRTASIYGASPYTNDAERSQWRVQVVGFTVRHLKAGTVGIGRQPWPTRQAAEDWLYGKAV